MSGFFFNDSDEMPSESPSKRSICTGGFPPIASSQCTDLPHFTAALWLSQNLTNHMCVHPERVIDSTGHKEPTTMCTRGRCSVLTRRIKPPTAARVLNSFD